MDITTAKEDDKTIVFIKSKINTITAPELESYLKDLLEQGVLKLILDFSGVKYISSAGLRALLVITKMLKARGGGLILAALNPEVKSVFEISGFTLIIPVVSNIEEAKDKL